MMSKQTKRYVPVGILYRWTHPTVNPYSCGVEVGLLACLGRWVFFINDRTLCRWDMGQFRQRSL